MFYSFQSTHISFVKFNPKHLIIIDDIANGIIFLIFLQDYSLLLYRNKIEFLKKN